MFRVAGCGTAGRSGGLLVALRRWRGSLAWLGLLLAAGCSTVVPPADRGAPPAAPSRHFALDARLSIRAGQQVDIVSLRWQRDPDEESLQVLSPLGSTVARLYQKAGEEAVLDEGGGRIRRGASLATLIAGVLGQPVPVDQLRWWVQGWQEEGGARLPEGEFRYGEWTVTLERAVQGQVSHLLAVNGDLRVRLVVDRFEVRP